MSEGWKTIETFARGLVVVEVSILTLRIPRYSMRVGWTDGISVGMWFPFKAGDSASYHEDVAECVADAESFISQQLSIHIKKEQDDLTAKRDNELAKRKRHDENVERRREENRQRAHPGGQKKNKGN